MILVTGSSGYIGSHLVKKLRSLNYDVVTFDKSQNQDIRNLEELNSIFEKGIDTVIHLAAMTSVTESITKPIQYYDNNVLGTINLLKCMEKHNVKRLIFASSASVYEDCTKFLNEDSFLDLNNPYAQSKEIIEKMLQDLENWNVLTLRLFNVAGIDDHAPSHLFPSIMRVVNGQEKILKVFCHKGISPVRDYVHVIDVIDAIIKGLTIIEKSCNMTFNVGSGVGHDIYDVVDAFELAIGKTIPLEFHSLREGEMLRCVADISRAEKELGWRPKLNLDDIVRSCLR